MHHRRLSAGFLHKAAAPIAYAGIRILGKQALDEIAAVKVAGCLPRYQIISHRRFSSAVSVWSRFRGVMTI